MGADVNAVNGVDQGRPGQKPTPPPELAEIMEHTLPELNRQIARGRITREQLGRFISHPEASGDQIAAGVDLQLALSAMIGLRFEKSLVLLVLNRMANPSYHRDRHRLIPSEYRVVGAIRVIHDREKIRGRYCPGFPSDSALNGDIYHGTIPISLISDNPEIWGPSNPSLSHVIDDVTRMMTYPDAQATRWIFLTQSGEVVLWK